MTSDGDATMKHHFGDLLDRSGDYWTIVPNRDRFLSPIDSIPEGDEAASIVTIGREDRHWERVFTLPRLVELTLHEPSQKQLEAVQRLSLKRLRITHARPKSIGSLSGASDVEELVLEYVSGFSDLSPLRDLRNLRSLHLENLRRVNDFSGLAGISSLKYLHICGTLDWKQPIADFRFLRELPNLEVLGFWQVINASPYPALLPAVHLRKLKKIAIAPNIFPAREYALLEVGLEGVEGAVWEPCKRFAYSQQPLPRNDPRSPLSEDEIRAKHPEVVICFDGRRLVNDPNSEWFVFLGKSDGRVKCSSPNAAERCAEYSTKYSQMKDAARALVNSLSNRVG